MQPVKILYCIDRIVRGGTETQLIGLIRRLDRRRFAPLLCTLRPSDPYLADARCPTIELDAPRIAAPSGFSRVRRLAGHLRKERVAIVQTFFQDATFFGITAARLAGVPVRLVAFRDMGFWRTRRSEFLMRGIYPLATGFLANSEAVRENVCRQDRLDPGRVEVVYNGTDPQRYPFVDHDEGACAVGFVGNLDRRVKRADLFLRAAAIVSKRHPTIGWHVIGDGDLRPGYETLACDLGICNRTRFAGRIVDVPGYLSHLGIGVVSSDSEGFSNAALEYMLAGCAVVATAAGGNRELVHDGETGLLVPPGDEQALAGAIAHMIENPDLRRSLARNARTFVEREFAWSRCVSAHERHYAEQLDHARGSKRAAA